MVCRSVTRFRALATGDPHFAALAQQAPRLPSSLRLGSWSRAVEVRRGGHIGQSPPRSLRYASVSERPVAQLRGPRITRAISAWVIWAGRRGILVSHSTVLPIAAVTMPPRAMMGSRHPFIFREPTSSANSPSYLRIPRPDDLQICPPGVAPWPLEKAKAAGEAACINMDSVTTIKPRAPIPFSRNSAKLLLAPRLREGRLLASSGSAGGRIGEGQLCDSTRWLAVIARTVTWNKE
jgi:hypothetical protein